MAENSSIEWTDSTFNPWIGCTKVSPACDHCYAERSTPSRTLGVAWGAGQERRRTTPANWALLKRWNTQAEAFQAQHGRRQRVFCASLADVFDNEVSAQWRVDLFRLIEQTPNLDWLLLTKRIGNVQRMMVDVAHALFWMDSLETGALPPNVWLGATICNQPEADRDITKLLRVPARVRFLSIEPLLGPVDLGLCDCDDGSRPGPGGTGGVTCMKCAGSGGRRVDWVIVGGESGLNARPMHPDWARGLRDQCAAAGVPFLFKQWGEWLPLSHQTGGADPEQRQIHVWPDGSTYTGNTLMTPDCAQLSRVGKKAAGRVLDGRNWDEVLS